jgi:hypothetical protein
MKAGKQEGTEIEWSDETGLLPNDVRGRNDAPKRQLP